ncbi:unnamed protein product [Rangifer tarandus platyrhynchus]|uniref:Uncharacterized protein n=2 Tax=Rangifer tarandus platyrhynchus TaxID=3082113 RepID=A0ACB0FMD4_RANTA|nr:unnamed protein product [Rangifer tarandus platyrhynchus]CAI9714242.1 unnamed protein product [Rangifer tarandus platyrhynchus]
MLPAWPAAPHAAARCSGSQVASLTLWGPPPRLCSPDATGRVLTLSSYASHWADGQGVETEAWQGLSLPVGPPVEKRLPSNKGRHLSLGFDDDV